MCNIVNLVFVNKVFFNDPRSPWEDFVNPATVLNCFDAGVIENEIRPASAMNANLPLNVIHYWTTFVLMNLFIRVDSYYEVDRWKG